MRFIKGSFFIIGKDEKDNVVVSQRNGWLDSEQKFGFHKFMNIWVGTDLPTGRAIYQAKTRKAVAEWIENHQELLERCHKHPKYQMLKDEFEELKSEERF